MADNNNFMFEALQRRQKMMGQSATPFDKMGMPTQKPGGMMGEGTGIDPGMSPAYAKKSVPSIKTK